MTCRPSACWTTGHDRTPALPGSRSAPTFVLVFDNTSVPVYAAGKADGAWDIAEVHRLPPDLASTIPRLAQQSPTPESAPAST